MFRILLVMLCALMGAGSAQAADALAVPAEIKTFIPKGHTLIALERGDLDGDGTQDYLLVTQEPEPSVPDDFDEEPGSRQLWIVTQEGGVLKLAAQADKAILCEGCGGVFGDPFVNVEMGEKTFTIHFYGGSSWRWAYDFTFNYSRRDKTWQLVKGTETSFHAGEPDKQEVGVYTPKDFGKIGIAEFDMTTYRPQEDKP